MFEIIVAIKRLFNSYKTRAIDCSINSLAAATSNLRSLLSRLRGQRFLLVKPWSFVIRDICIPSRSLHSSCNAAARCTEIPEMIVLSYFGYPQFSNESYQMNGATTCIALITSPLSSFLPFFFLFSLY